ncbi:Methyltransferase domain-containing protein [Colletotrichum higginsianum IMI 349063]|uniref:Methyltransferase domain-containing protein n=1 Tax=Colletotrichum higginsianum (strain IMI 349063) TaxID=759273 RepID=A0A1B7XZ79_COLHI|nr:Methyltransferase domain-containing protein [Colletotrichum higginsianum IMI 349063]OBR05083.1 Methyltransferase domain-containing protein [Colletotrichum higginsianum IMI 349063]
MADNQANAASANDPAPAIDPPAPNGTVLNTGPVIVADDDLTDDAASDMATSVASSSASLASSILRHRIENGRTYHKYKDGKYAYPNDEKENDRLDLQHNIFLLTLNYKLGLAPPNDENSGVKRVLDIGTGTGLWAIDFGEEHPEAEVIGVDLTPVPTAFVPPNVKFEVDDIEEPWMYSQPFDYIHTRAMTSSIANWGKFLKQIYNGLTPGGYVELFEGNFRPECDDGTLTPEHALSEWVDKFEECGRILGRLIIDVPSLVPILNEIGFVDVTIVKYKWPINPWAKDPHYRELGSWCLENLLEGIEGFSMGPFTRCLEWTREEVNVFLIDVRKDLKDKSIHAYSPLWTIYARRPLEEPEEPAPTV